MADSLHASDVDPVFDVAAEAAAAKLGVSTELPAASVEDGTSLKQLADERQVGYGTVARAVNGSVADVLAAAVARGNLSHHQADEIRSAVAGWIDHGGLPDDTGWFGRPD